MNKRNVHMLPVAEPRTNLKRKGPETFFLCLNQKAKKELDLPEERWVFRGKEALCKRYFESYIFFDFF